MAEGHNIIRRMELVIEIIIFPLIAHFMRNGQVVLLHYLTQHGQGIPLMVGMMKVEQRLLMEEQVIRQKLILL